MFYLVPLFTNLCIINQLPLFYFGEISIAPHARCDFSEDGSYFRSARDQVDEKNGQNKFIQIAMFCQLRYFLVTKSSLEISNCDLVVVWKKASRRQRVENIVESVVPGLKNTWQGNYLGL